MFMVMSFFVRNIKLQRPYRFLADACICYQVIKFYRRHHDLINRYVLSVSQITMNINTNHWHKYTTSVIRVH